MTKKQWMSYKVRSRAVLATLQAHGGAVESKDGLATSKLHDLLPAEYQYAGQASGFDRLMYRMADEGLVERDIWGQRCYRIAATKGVLDAWTNSELRGADFVEEPESPLPPEPDTEEPAPEAIDYGRLAMTLLDRAIAAGIQARDNDARIAELETEMASLSSRGTELNRTLQEEHQRVVAMKAELASALETERRRTDQAEQAAKVFRERAEELDRELHKIKGELQSTYRELTRRRNGYPASELMSERSREELARLMKQPPRAHEPEDELAR